MGFRENINKIHYDLTSKYKVSVEEGQNTKGYFVKIVVNENNKQLIVSIDKTSLENNLFDWTYNSNPLNENSDNIERTSTTDNFLSHVDDIFEKNRFSEEYLKKLS